MGKSFISIPDISFQAGIPFVSSRGKFTYMITIALISAGLICFWFFIKLVNFLEKI